MLHPIPDVPRRFTRLDAGVRIAALVMTVMTWGCSSAIESPADHAEPTPVYHPETGRLEQVLLDLDGDGVHEARAFMDGGRLLRIEIDRDLDGQVDRWEYYSGEAPLAAAADAGRRFHLERIEEANGGDERITRREFYEQGLPSRNEDDTNADGRVDKWEFYEGGVLARVELDLAGAGVPTRRLVYGRDGTIARAEENSDGRGIWRLSTPVP